MHPHGVPDHHPVDKKIKPLTGHRTILNEWLDKPCQIHMMPNPELTHSLWACWILRQVAKSSEDLLIKNTAEQHPTEHNATVLTVFETFASGNRRKRALRSLAEFCHVAAINPWNDTAITFNASDKPQFRTV